MPSPLSLRGTRFTPSDASFPCALSQDILTDLSAESETLDLEYDVQDSLAHKVEALGSGAWGLVSGSWAWGVAEVNRVRTFPTPNVPFTPAI